MKGARDFAQWLIDNGREQPETILPLYTEWRDLPVSTEAGRFAQYQTEFQFNIDGRYVIRKGKKDFTLYELKSAYGKEPTMVVLAIYANEAELVSDLINHSIRRTGVMTVIALIDESQRLGELCAVAFEHFRQ